MSRWTKAMIAETRVNAIFPCEHSQYFGTSEGSKDFRLTITDINNERRLALYHRISRPIYVDSVSCCDGRQSTKSTKDLVHREILQTEENSCPISGFTLISTVSPRWLRYTSLFTLTVAYTVEGEQMADSEPATPTTPSLALSSLSIDLEEKLFLAEDSSDVAFVIGEEVIPAHKCILMARIDVFRRMFSSGMTEATTGRIPIDDTDAATFKQLLRFVYTGKFPQNLDEIADLLLPITEKYGIQQLKEACAAALKARICRDNVIHTLILAHLYNCPDLKKECFMRLTEFKTSLDPRDLGMLKPYPDLMVEAIQKT